MTIATYGAPYFTVIIESLIPFTTVGDWVVKLDSVAIPSVGKDLLSIINSLQATYGIFVDNESYPGNCFLRNTSNVDHVLEITYIGNVSIDKNINIYGNSYTDLSRGGKVIEIPLGGFNAITTWVYPPFQLYTSYKDVDIKKRHVSGNSYVLELDGVRYTDPREPKDDDGKEYGNIPNIIQHNGLSDILQARYQTSIGENYHNYQLVNIDNKPHTVKIYVDKTKPIGNTNFKAGTFEEVHTGKAIYCTTDNNIGAPTFGSVNSRVVDNNGISAVLAPLYISSFSIIHSYENSIDARFETIVILSGTVKNNTSRGKEKILPSLAVTVMLGNDEYWPDIILTDTGLEWSLTLISKQFAIVDSYTVIATRNGGVNPYHVAKTIVSPVIYRHFTTYDDIASPLVSNSFVLDKNELVLSLSTLGITNPTGITYASGTKSGSIANVNGININGDDLVIKTFTGTYKTTSVEIINNIIGEIALVVNAGTPSITLVSNIDISKPTPLYNTEFIDYAYVAVGGLGKEVFTTDMFSTTNSGHCIYLADQDINLWLLRI